ncbi:MAG TPA: hypothetical protein PK370_03000 [Candidatus Woesebacteria bacterium]|mgnify:CR=1 FL=1|nr:hypothetical protein [Candidatus Woesebacteria bacterium]
MEERKPWILIAEDNGQVLEMLCFSARMVGGRDVEIVGVRSVKEGIDEIKKRGEPPQRAILDVFSNGQVTTKIDPDNSFLRLGGVLVLKETPEIVIFGASKEANRNMSGLLNKVVRITGNSTNILIENKPGDGDISDIFSSVQIIE